MWRKSSSSSRWSVVSAWTGHGRSEERRGGEEWRWELRCVLFRSYRRARKEIRERGLNRLHVAEEFFKLALECGLGLDRAREIGRAAWRGRVEMGVKMCAFPILPTCAKGDSRERTKPAPCGGRVLQARAGVWSRPGQGTGDRKSGVEGKSGDGS